MIIANRLAPSGKGFSAVWRLKPNRVSCVALLVNVLCLCAWNIALARPNEAAQIEAGGQVTIKSTYPSSGFAPMYDNLGQSLRDSNIFFAYEPIKTPQAMPQIAITVAGVLAEKVVTKLVDYVYETYVKPKESKEAISYYIVDTDYNISFVLPRERDKLAEYLSSRANKRLISSAFADSSELKMAQLSLSSSGAAQDALIRGLREMMLKKNLNALKSLLWIVKSTVGGAVGEGVLSAQNYEDMLKQSSGDYVSLFYLYTYAWLLENNTHKIRFQEESKSFIRGFRQFPTSRILTAPDEMHSEALKPFLTATAVHSAAKVQTEPEATEFFYAILRSHVSNATVVHGDNANMKLQIGAGLKLKWDNMRDLWEKALLHEFGHIQLDYLAPELLNPSAPAPK
jgi:hypothetical protein